MEEKKEGKNNHQNKGCFTDTGILFYAVVDIPSLNHLAEVGLLPLCW